MVLKDTCARTHVGILVGTLGTSTIFHTMVNWITWSIVNQNRLADQTPKRTEVQTNCRCLINPIFVKKHEIPTPIFDSAADNFFKSLGRVELVVALKNVALPFELITHALYRSYCPHVC